ncbi:MAG: AAA family ATPase [Bacteroidota bacterium]|nr:AAA family ATPase [Bacteroidota bacterium]
MNTPENLKALNEKIKKESQFIKLLEREMHKVIIGQKHLIDSLLIGLLSDGHILLEGVPGLAKTLSISTLAKAINVDFSRIQFTPDLLPADLLGTMIYSQKQEEFVTKKGPIFSNFVLADEINRAPAKVQSALLESMQEKQITLGTETYKLEPPFLVLATQNPIEQEGTYPLPEAQVDRFMLKVKIGYTAKNEEKMIIRQNINKEFPKAQPVVSKEDILRIRELIKEIYLDERIENYITDIVFATRFPENYKLSKFRPMIAFGASPRASINLAKAAGTYAFMQGRAAVFPEDIRAVSLDVMRHRIGLTYEAEAENINSEDIITEILNTIDVP